MRYFCNLAYMKATLTVSKRGVVTLPAKLRQAAGIRPEEPIIAETDGDGLILHPAVTLPVEVYTDERVAEFDAAEADLAPALCRRPRR